MSTRCMGMWLLCAWLAGCASADPGATEQQVRALEQEQVHAVMARDRAAIERLFAPDFMIINPSGAVADKQALLDLLMGGEAPYRSGTYQTETVRIYGDTVVTTGLETVVPARGATAGQNVQRRITHVWERQKAQGSWQLALRHATVVTPPP